MNGTPWTQWVVYYGPSDYPGRYVVRAQDIMPGLPEPVPRPWCFVGEQLEQVRGWLENHSPGLIRIDRDPSDHHTIVETWV